MGFRDAGSSDESLFALSHVVSGDGPYLPGALHEVLYQRIQQLGWRVVTGSIVTDGLGSFDLLHCDWHSLLQRVHSAWTRVVAGRVAHRPTFKAFAQVDRVATRKSVLCLCDYEQGIMRRHLNGSQGDNSVSCKWTSSGSDRCVLCGLPDSMQHRLWECAQAADLRLELEPWVLDVVDDVPEVCRLHGWTLQSPLQEDWRRYLLSLSSGVPKPLGVMPQHVIVDLFTDGSCLWPSEPAYRLASFSVIMAPPLDFDNCSGGFQVLAAAPLAGLVQTAYRAELMGLLTALQFAVWFHWHVRIWCDCESVLTKFELLRQGLRSVRPSMPHFDLWTQVQQCATQLGDGRIQVVKVPAHEDRSKVDSAFEQWMVQGNEIADLAAKQANTCRPPLVWRAWEQHVHAVHVNRRLGECLRHHIVRTACRWTDVGKESVESDSPLQFAKPSPKVAVWPLEAPLQLKSRNLLKHFGSAFAERVVNWFNNIWGNRFEVRWVSYIQLWIIYQQQVGDAGVAKIDGKWFTFSAQEGSTPEQFHTRKLTKWFRLMLQMMLKDGHCKYASTTTRPWSGMLACHVGCLGLPLLPALQSNAESWLAGVLDRPARGQGSDLKLPLIG